MANPIPMDAILVKPGDSKVRQGMKKTLINGDLYWVSDLTNTGKKGVNGQAVHKLNNQNADHLEQNLDKIIGTSQNLFMGTSQLMNDAIDAQKRLSIEPWINFLRIVQVLSATALLTLSIYGGLLEKMDYQTLGICAISISVLHAIGQLGALKLTSQIDNNLKASDRMELGFGIFLTLSLLITSVFVLTGGQANILGNGSALFSSLVFFYGAGLIGHCFFANETQQAQA